MRISDWSSDVCSSDLVKLDVLIRRPHWQDAEIYLLGERTVPRGIGFDRFGDARILALLSFSDFGANRRLRNFGGFLLNVALRDAIEQIGVGLEAELAALQRHVIVEVVAEHIGFDDEIPALAQILPCVGLKKLL